MCVCVCDVCLCVCVNQQRCGEIDYSANCAVIIKHLSFKSHAFFKNEVKVGQDLATKFSSFKL